MEVKLNKKKTRTKHAEIRALSQRNKQGGVYSSVDDMIWKYREDRSRE